MLILIGQMIVIILHWSVWLCCISGIGLLVLRAMHLTPTQAWHWASAFWGGWTLVVLMLQLWHLVLPINAVAVVGLMGIGLSGILLQRQAVADLGQSLWAAPRTVGMAAMVLVWLANHAAGAVTDYDTGLYHYQSVRWATDYALVPGLGNLHERLAFNSAHLLYAALFEYPRANHAHQLANGLMVLALALQVLAAARAIHKQQDATHADLLLVLLAAGVLLLVILPPGIASLSTDVPIFVLGSVSSAFVAILLHQPLQSNEYHWLLWLLLTLAAAGVAAKLSFIGFATGLVFIVCIAGGGLWRIEQPHLSLAIREVGTMLGWVGLWASLWMLRSVGLSGYPLFPSDSVAVPVAWQIPAAAVAREAAYIRGWARAPGLPSDAVIHSWQWLGAWLHGTLRAVVVWVPLALGGYGLVLLWIAPHPTPVRNWRSAGILLAPVISLIFWFLNAPAVRFAGAAIWLIAASILLHATRHRPRHGLFLAAATLLIVSLVAWGQGPFAVAPHPLTGRYVLPNPPLRSVSNQHGTRISVPA
ncbi:MAG: hypothetical protein HC911_12385, partial [Chloroflexaceae bacterium]|nr:hypothetical protein [Chloroflexaceae bacterium]